MLEQCGCAYWTVTESLLKLSEIQFLAFYPTSVLALHRGMALRVRNVRVRCLSLCLVDKHLISALGWTLLPMIGEQAIMTWALIDGCKAIFLIHARLKFERLAQEAIWWKLFA